MLLLFCSQTTLCLRCLETITKTKKLRFWVISRLFYLSYVMSSQLILFGQQSLSFILPQYCLRKDRVGCALIQVWNLVRLHNELWATLLHTNTFEMYH